MSRCIFENLTPQQAEELASWFEGQGEQDCSTWFEMREIKSPMTDVSRKGGYCEPLANGDVIVYCK